MNLKVNSLTNVISPAHLGDAGYDIVAASEPKIVGSQPIANYFNKIEYIEYDTNLVIAPSEGYHTFLMPRSSISKTNLVLANSVGLIDNGYRGTIKVRFKYIPQPIDFNIVHNDVLIEIDHNSIYQKGDKIGQLVFAKTLLPSLCLVDSFDETTRQEGGFGSTGKKISA